MPDPTNRQKDRGSKVVLIRWLSAATVHLLGTASVFMIMMWMLLPASSRAALFEAYHHGAFQNQYYEFLLHAGLSACFWAMLFIGWKLLTLPGQDRPRRLVKARGTVIVETLVVLPVFLFLNVGLIQLTLLNTAGLLTTLGAFKAGRAVALWHPEALADRNDVTLDLVREKAHLAAAAAIAPVAPSDFVFNSAQCGNSGSLNSMISAMEAIGHISDDNPDAALDGMRESRTLSRAFDHANFGIRGQRKLRFAHCAITVDYVVDNSNQQIYTVVEYRQQMAMPFIAHVFGTVDQVAGRQGRYHTLIRDNITYHQIEPNTRTPGGMF